MIVPTVKGQEQAELLTGYRQTYICFVPRQLFESPVLIRERNGLRRDTNSAAVMG